MITVLCLIIGALSYSKLPTEIPVQWSKGVATSLVNKNWIFICPIICIIIRYLLKPFIYAKLQMNNYYGEIITEYLTNYMCFIVLSVEIFSILFTFGVVKNIVVLLFVDTVVFYWIVSRWADENGFERKRNFMIQISNLSKKYGETVVFSDLNYTFENACIYGLVGRNGAGKTTLLNILSNYDKNYTGVISIDRKKMNKVDYLDMPVAYARINQFFI